MSHGNEWVKRNSEFSAWRNMKARCLDPRHKSYPRYGGRGITVCERWVRSYPDFLADVGPRPATNMTLDRIDNYRGYEPGNVRWATRSEQQRNKEQASHCQRGHRLDPANVYVRKNGRRQCKACTRLREQRRLRSRSREQAQEQR